jgi:hypothetical protein
MRADRRFVIAVVVAVGYAAQDVCCFGCPGSAWP